MITEIEYQNAAKLVGCEEAAVKAVCAVESGRSGFLKSGKIVLKFEGHIFHKYTQGRFDQDHPTLSYPAWTEKYSQFGEQSYIRFDQAFNLDAHAAMISTSWGLFQIMGFNYSSCGFKSVDEFITSLKIDESHHVEAFCRYVVTLGLNKYLAAKNWAMFADRYNGADYKKHHYDLQLQTEYDKFKNP